MSTSIFATIGSIHRKMNEVLRDKKEKIEDIEKQNKRHTEQLATFKKKVDSVIQGHREHVNGVIN